MMVYDTVVLVVPVIMKLLLSYLAAIMVIYVIYSLIEHDKEDQRTQRDKHPVVDKRQDKKTATPYIDINMTSISLQREEQEIPEKRQEQQQQQQRRQHQKEKEKQQDHNADDENARTIQRLQNEIERMRIDDIGPLRKEKENLKTDNTRLQEQNENLNTVVQVLLEENENMNRENQRIQQEDTTNTMMVLLQMEEVRPMFENTLLRFEDNMVRNLQLQEEDDNKNNEIRRLTEENNNKDTEMQRIQEENKQKDRNIQRLQVENNNKSAEIRRLTKENNNKDTEIQRIQEESNNKGRNMQRLQVENNNKSTEIRRLMKDNNDKDTKMQRIEVEKNNKDRCILRLEEENNKKDTEIKHIQEENSSKDRNIQHLQEENNENKKTIQRLEEEKYTMRGSVTVLKEELGRGAYGKVYAGDFYGTKVAVKEFHEIILSPHNRRLILREIEIASQCRHPNLLQFMCATKNDKNHLLIVTELMDMSLRKLIVQHASSESRINEQGVKTICVDIAKALNYLHSKTPNAIIHRDVSSANVLLWVENKTVRRAKLSDYGSANFMQICNTANPGAILYAAPEAGRAQQDPKIDVYSYGMLVCETCICELPDPENKKKQRNRITNAGIKQLVVSCTKDQPRLRPSMEAVIGILQELK